MTIQTDAVPEASGSADAVRLRVNKLELLERLADDLAHEIKNPLHSMVINLEVLKRRAARVGGEGAEDLQRYAGVLSSELERVNRRIELLLRLSRPARGTEVASLGELLDELMELVELEAKHYQLSVDYQPPAVPVRVRLPRESGRQMILNLVLEAIENAAAGGCLHIGLAQGEGTDATIEVGCAAGRQPERAPGRTSERLAVVRTLAEAAGGRLGDEGPGRRVLTLPRAGGQGT